MMVVGNLDLGLSLSLGTTTTATNTTNSQNHNQMAFMMMMKGNDTTPPHETTSFLRGIDVNRLVCHVDDEEPGVSSPNSTVSTLSGKRSSAEREEDNDVERNGSSDDDEGGENCRKKLRLSKDQSAILEESFKEHNTLNPKQKLALAKRLGLRPRQVEVWFQNRRARTKLKQTEVDCEYLKRWCEQMKEENRRLHKEVQELRAFKMSPQLYMHMTPPTTLTMCPSCERIAVPPTPSPSYHQPGAMSRPVHRAVPTNIMLLQ